MAKRRGPIEPWEALDSYGSVVGNRLVKRQPCVCDEPSISRIATPSYEYCMNCGGVLKIICPF